MKLISEIEGFEEFTGYGITSCGKVWSFKTNKFLKPSYNKQGYVQITLCKKDRKLKTFTIHRLVALAYVTNPNNFKTVDHIDENKEHNYVNNLRWLSPGENKSRSWSKPIRCIETGQIFKSATVAAEEMNLGRRNISYACSGKQKTAGGFHFEFI